MDITLHGSRIKSESDLHQVLSEKLDLGPYYGRNLAALWDRLTTDVARPVRMIWKDADLSRAGMGDEVFARIVSLFRDVEQQDLDFGRSEMFTFLCE